MSTLCGGEQCQVDGNPRFRPWRQPARGVEEGNHAVFCRAGGHNPAKAVNQAQLVGWISVSVAIRAQTLEFAVNLEWHRPGKQGGWGRQPVAR